MPTIHPAGTAHHHPLSTGSPALPGLLLELGAAAVRRVWVAGVGLLVADHTPDQ